MSFLSFNRVGAALGPVAIADLHAIFNTLCNECAEPKTSNRAEQTAAVLIRSYQRGIEDKTVLVDIGRAVIRSGDV